MNLRTQFAIFIGVLFVVILLPLLFLLFQDEQDQIEIVAQEKVAELDREATFIEGRLSGYQEDIRTIHNLPPIQGIVRSGEALDNIDPLDGSSIDTWKNRLEQIFMGYSMARPWYTQIRYLDANGQELVRVNSTAGGSYPVRKDNLANKSNEPYFQEARKKGPGEVYISSLEPNVEDGSIEEPIRPTMRFVQNVYGDYGEFRGMVVINVEGSNFTQIIESFEGDMVLVDQDGFFLRNPSASDKEFGGSLGTGEKYEHFLQNKEFILGSASSYHLAEEQQDLFVHRVIKYDEKSPKRFFVLIEKVPEKKILAPVQEDFRNNIITLVIIFILGFLGTQYFFARPMVRKIQGHLGALHKISGGDLFVRLDAKGSDEIAQVGMGINKMATALQQNVALITKRGELSAALTEILDLEALLEKVGEVAQELISAKYAVIAEVEKDEIVLFKFLGLKKEEAGQLEVLSVESGIFGKVLKSDEPVLVSDFANSDVSSGFAEKGPKVANALGVSLRYGEEHIGVLYLMEKKGGFLEADIQAIEELAEVAAIAVNNARLFREVKSLDQLRSRFIQVVSHQLRTPLNSMRWNLEALLSEDLGKLKKEQQALIRLTYSADIEIIERLHDLIMAMDIEEGRVSLSREKTTLGSLWESVKESQKGQYVAKKVSLEYEASKEELPKLAIDPAKIRDVMLKLSLNAVVYTSEGGKVSAKIFRKGASLRFEISDTGIGIPKDEQDNIFGRFYRASNAATMLPDASGLGLFLAKHIVEAHGGTKDFVSEEGKGSTFGFELPLYSGESFKDE